MRLGVTNASQRAIALLVLTSLVFILPGCGAALRTDYGKSRGISGDKSINGFGVLRRAYAREGWATRDVARLNQRLKNVDAVVWTPSYRDTLHADATAWFDQWLSEKTRTLVYVIPDGGCDREYFELARQSAPPQQQLEYRRRIARLTTDKLLERLRDEAIAHNGWFQAQRLDDGMTLGATGAWASALKTKSAAKLPPGAGPFLSYEVVPVPQTIGQPTSPPTTPPNPALPNATPAPPIAVGPTPPQVSGVKVQHRKLLAAEDGSPAIIEIHADEWGDSKIIVIGSGSLLCNYTLASPPGQAIAQQLIASTAKSPGMVGFIASDYRGVSVSENDDEINAMTGMEILTVWPLNLITIHLAMIGFIACLVMFPIFGRPSTGEEPSSSDFSDHLDAVASLMHKSGGENYARQRVSEYMKRVRGETTGPWVITEPPPPVNLPPANLPTVSTTLLSTPLKKETP